jgi:hypothetical protein
MQGVEYLNTIEIKKRRWNNEAKWMALLTGQKISKVVVEPFVRSQRLGWQR